MNEEHQRRPAGLQARVLGRFGAIALLLLLVVVPLASAQPDVARAALTAKQVHLAGPTEETGDLDLLYLHRVAATPETNIPGLTLTAERVTATTYDQDAHEFYGPPGTTDGDTTGACQKQLQALGWTYSCVVTTTAVGVKPTVHLTAVQNEYIMNLFGSGLTHHATYSTADGKSLPNPLLTRSGIDTAFPETQATPGGPSWTNPIVMGGHVMTHVGNEFATLQIDGDFVLEVLGADFEMTDATAKTILHSGVERDALVPGAPSTVHTYRQTFLRLTVIGGHLDLSVSNPNSEFEWTAHSVAVSTQGALTLEQASGHMSMVDGTDVDVTASTVKATGNNRLALAPNGGALAADLQRVQPDSQAAAPAITSGNGAVLVGIILSVGALAAVVFALARRSRMPILADVEAAIEAGHYRRAAADAGRILRRRPSEDALLSRAIALCKGGKAGRVVHEVTDYLETSKPSDGSLHYVLGLAYLDLGKRADAETVFDEAVRRTPSLLTDVQGKLGASGTTSRTPGPLQGVESPHGYA